MRRIDELHLEHPFMGARMLRRQLRQVGVKVGRRHVATLMKKMGIEALAPQPGTSQRALGHKIYPNTVRLDYFLIYIFSYIFLGGTGSGGSNCGEKFVFTFRAMERS
jgi:hypothetical protein